MLAGHTRVAICSFPLRCNGRGDVRLARVFSNRTQQVSYDNFITVVSAFCLQRTQTVQGKKERRGVEKVREGRREPQNPHGHTINTEETPGGSGQLTSVAEGTQFGLSVLSSRRAIACVYFCHLGS